MFLINKPNSTIKVTGNKNGCVIYNFPDLFRATEIQIINFITKTKISLNDIKLRNIILTEEEKEFVLGSFSPGYYENRFKYYSSAINNFISKTKKEIEEIPKNAYIELSEKYYPILLDIIKNSKTLGDIIDNFKIVYKNISQDLPFFITASKYNI